MMPNQPCAPIRPDNPASRPEFELVLGVPATEGGSPRLTRANFNEMAELEAKFYADEYIADADEARAWYERFPYTSTVTAFDGARVAGFVNLFPVTDAVFGSIRAGTFNDKYLTIDDVADIVDDLAAGGRSPADGDPLHMFLSCIVVDEGYRGGLLVPQLLRAAVDLYAPVERRIDFIVTDNVTPEGSRFSQRYGFAPVCASNHASQVYEQRYGAFARTVREKASRR